MLPHSKSGQLQITRPGGDDLPTVTTGRQWRHQATDVRINTHNMSSTAGEKILTNDLTDLSAKNRPTSFGIDPAAASSQLGQKVINIAGPGLRTRLTFVMVSQNMLLLF